MRNGKVQPRTNGAGAASNGSSGAREALQNRGGVRGTPSDPFRTYSHLEQLDGVGPPSSSSSGGLLGRCRPCTTCSLRAVSGEVAIDASIERYPMADVEALRPLKEDAAEDGEYTLLEDIKDDEEKDAETMVTEMNTMKESVKGMHKALILLLLLVVGLASGVSYYVFIGLTPVEQQTARRYGLLASIPIIALLFTWFHIWLAIQMMFLPIRFLGLWQYRETGMGIGWQGIVPRKSHKMATMAYSSARPYLDGPRDWMSRVDGSQLTAQIRPQLREIVSASLDKVIDTHFPSAGSMLSLSNMRENITNTALDKIQASANDLWRKWIDLLCDPDIGVDNDEMIVKVFTENKELLNDFFMRLGKREFRFIEHCGAAMGFFCGCMQLLMFNQLSPVGRAIFLPLSGFFLGIISNWAAITCVFKPCFPIPIKICGCHICNLQGLFLKRQPEVAVLYSKLLCEHFLSFPKVVNFLQTKTKLWAKLKETYMAYNAKVMKESLGMSTTLLAPLALGQDQFDKMEEDIKISLVKGLAKSTDIHKIGGRYIAKVTNIEKNNAKVLKTMPPDQFEDLLHPVFQEDEWILILLGGVLGAIVGIGQVFLMSS